MPGHFVPGCALEPRAEFCAGRFAWDRRTSIHPTRETSVKMIRLRLFALVLTAGGVGACLCHRAVTGWEDANHPDPARQRELEILEDYTREADAIFQKHGRVMTPEWEKEEEELRRATRRRLAELRGCE
jgi:hypothetical protein